MFLFLGLAYLTQDSVFYFHSFACKLQEVKLSIIIDGENKIFHDKVKFTQYVPNNPALQKVLEGKHQHKKVNDTNEFTRNNFTAAKPKEEKNAITTTQTYETL